ncbi:MAG TPA: helix-turn-helix domain-containing protein [Nitrospirota bacterium]|nr:helix-turn-helix domain-containing protein [Nitrospirota bacterium]
MDDIGRILKERRMACGLELGDVAKRTCIRTYYLKAMEEGRFNNIPKVFDKGYLRIYAKLLDMESLPLLALYERQQCVKPVHPSNFTKQPKR